MKGIGTMCSDQTHSLALNEQSSDHVEFLRLNSHYPTLTSFDWRNLAG